MAFETTTAIATQLNSGRIRALATTGASRSKSMPDVPTMKELGYPSFVIENWYGLFVPAKTPAHLVKRLNQELNKVLRSPEVTASLGKMGSSDVAGTPEEFAQYIVKELPYWESLVKRSGATVD
jgi:tripartite-type tricarboxylate transporter receptor subunit TctC